MGKFYEESFCDGRFDITLPNLKIFDKRGMVIIVPSDIGLLSLRGCEINGKVYKSARLYSSDIYIHAEELRCGCILNFRAEKKTYFIKARGFLNLFVYVCELPYKENAEYSVEEAYKYLKHNKKTIRCFSTVPS